MNDIVFVKGQGGLGRPLPGEDYVSGLLFYTANGNLPSGFSTSNRVKKFTSVADAETAGILADYSDATASTATYLITTKGSTGDTIQAKYTGIGGVVLDLGTYTVSSSETTIAAQGAAWAAVINAGTYEHGCSASFSTATLTITLPKSQGVFPNSGTPTSIVIVGDFVGTLTQAVVSGVASKQAVWHYHISEFFRLQPKGVLYVGFYAVPGGAYDYAEVTTMQTFADGKIRQIGVYVDSKAFAVGDTTILNTQIVNNCDANHMPLSAIYCGNIAAVSNLTTLTNLNTLANNKVSVVIGQDGAGLGYFLWIGTGKTIGTLGATLGAVAFGNVADDIAWVSKYNLTDGYELDTPAFGNGSLVKDIAVNALETLNNYRYIFIKKFIGIPGTYFNDSHTAIISSSDYAYIENNRTIDKAIRNVYANVLPALNSPIVLNADGTLTNESVAYFQSLAQSPLFQMLRDQEISAQGVTIDPAQNVLAESKLVIAIQIVPIGVARTIQVNIGFTAKIA